MIQYVHAGTEVKRSKSKPVTSDSISLLGVGIPLPKRNWPEAYSSTLSLSEAG